MKIQKLFPSQLLNGALIGATGMLLLLLVFKLGTVVGARQADFSCRWSENYHRNFGGPKGGMFKGFRDNNFIEAHGTFGQIIKIDGATLVVKGRGDVEKVVLITESTVIKRGRESISISDLRADDYIVTIGSPNSAGEIQAKLIRILDLQKNAR